MSPNSIEGSFRERGNHLMQKNDCIDILRQINFFRKKLARWPQVWPNLSFDEPITEYHIGNCQEIETH
jgi:hypothetical protein